MTNKQIKLEAMEIIAFCNGRHARVIGLVTEHFLTLLAGRAAAKTNMSPDQFIDEFCRIAKETVAEAN